MFQTPTLPTPWPATQQMAPLPILCDTPQGGKGRRSLSPTIFLFTVFSQLWHTRVPFQYLFCYKGSSWIFCDRIVFNTMTNGHKIGQLFEEIWRGRWKFEQESSTKPLFDYQVRILRILSGSWPLCMKMILTVCRAALSTFISTFGFTHPTTSTVVTLTLRFWPVNCCGRTTNPKQGNRFKKIYTLKNFVGFTATTSC